MIIKRTSLVLLLLIVTIAVHARITITGTVKDKAQWEWAARGGVKSQGYTYAGSNNSSKRVPTNWASMT